MQANGKVIADDEFDKLCFEFGIELDDIEVDPKDSSLVTYKIDIPANRYDLLCAEGLGRALKIFTGSLSPVAYKTSQAVETLFVEKSTAQIRPICVAAVLRNVHFTEESYESFIYLQEKLHQNVCRKRTLVAIGTHDLDTIKGPFRYKALPPKSISFVPLKKTVEMDGETLMKHYETDLSLKQYLPIIRDSPVYPVIYDSKGVVLSLPPIINGEHSKITVKTKNVFIECTATDMTKAKIVLDTMVTMFSEYCKVPFEVEQVKIVYEDKEILVPDLGNFVRTEKVSDLVKMTGVQMESKKVVDLLSRMSLETSVVDSDTLKVQIPPTRSDILHTCDLMEDLAIAYGYNNIPQRVPPTYTVGKPDPLNKLTDLLRYEMAQCGFMEALTLTLCSVSENFDNLKRAELFDLEAVKLSNPKTIEYEVVRTLLLPGLLKTIHQNSGFPLPIKLFEVADVVTKTDEKTVNGVTAKNERHLAALFCSQSSGFETIHGLLNRIMDLLGAKFNDEKSDECYKLVPSKDEFLFPSRRVDIFFKGRKIGRFGIVQPTVLEAFEVKNVCSILEMNIEPFL